MTSARALGCVVGVLLLGIILGCGGGRAVKQGGEEVDQGPQAPAKPDLNKPAEPAVPVTAEQLAREVHSNPAAAEQKYKGKLLEVEGVVKSMLNHIGGGTVVMLKGLDGKIEGKFVLVPCVCNFEGAGQGKAEALSEGQQVKIRGRCFDVGRMPTLNACEVVTAGADPAPHVQTDRLAQEFAQDQQKANEKYLGKYVVASGVVREVRMEGEGGYLVFEGSTKDVKPLPVVAQCTSGFSYKDILKGIKKGERREVKGQCWGVEKGEVRFLNPYVVRQAK
jgi:hypothetical protein